MCRAIAPYFAAAAVLFAVPALAQGPLARADIEVVGLTVDVDTRPDLPRLQYTMTAVKDIPTGVHTIVGFPAQNAPDLPPGALVHADLVGPQFNDAPSPSPRRRIISWNSRRCASPANC